VPAATQYTGAQLAQLETARQARPDGHLLDLLPVPGDLMTHLPTRWHAQLHDAFAMENRCRHDPRQVTIHATLITATPGALAQIICQRGQPAPALAAAFSDSERNPGVASQIRNA